MTRSSLRLLLSGFVVILGVGVLPLRADLRTLTDKLGRSIKAEVISVEDGKVKIKREDGRTFEMPLTALSESDQRALAEWALKEATRVPPNALKIGLSRGVFTSDKRETISTITTEEEWGYSVTVTNNSFKTIKNLKFKYVLFVKPDDGPGRGRNDRALKRSVGSSKVDVVEPHDRAVFRTDSIKVYKQKLQPGWIWSETGNAEMTRDTLHGIWIRAYSGDELVAEVCTPDSLMKTEKAP